MNESVRLRGNSPRPLTEAIRRTALFGRASGRDRELVEFHSLDCEQLAEIVELDFHEGDTVLVDVEDDELRFENAKAAEPAAV